MDYHKAIQEYNDNISFPNQIEKMSDLFTFLDEYGYSYDEYENVYDLYDLINVRDFDTNDEYFWLGKSGYLYSGSAEEAYDAKVAGSNDTIDNTETLYRYTIEIDGTRYGFITGIDKLIENGIIDEDNPLLKKINVLFSDLQVPSWRAYSDDKRCYFTEKGYNRFSRVIDAYAAELKKLGYNVILETKTVDINNIEYADDDEYQVLAKLHRLIKKAEYK